MSFKLHEPQFLHQKSENKKLSQGVVTELKGRYAHECAPKLTGLVQCRPSRGGPVLALEFVTKILVDST